MSTSASTWHVTKMIAYNMLCNAKGKTQGQGPCRNHSNKIFVTSEQRAGKGLIQQHVQENTNIPGQGLCLLARKPPKEFSFSRLRASDTPTSEVVEEGAKLAD